MCSIAWPVHPAQIYDRTVAQSSQTPNLYRIQWTLAGVRPGSKDRRQKINLRTGAIGLVDFPAIMNRCAVKQPPGSGSPGCSSMHAVGAPELGERRGAGQKHHMPAPPRKLFDHFKSRLPQWLFQMIVAKDNPASTRQSHDRLLEKIIIPLVGEQPYPGQGRTGRVR